MKRPEQRKEAAQGQPRRRPPAGPVAPRRGRRRPPQGRTRGTAVQPGSASHPQCPVPCACGVGPPGMPRCEGRGGGGPQPPRPHRWSPRPDREGEGESAGEREGDGEREESDGKRRDFSRWVEKEKLKLEYIFD